MKRLPKVWLMGVLALLVAAGAYLTVRKMSRGRESHRLYRNAEISLKVASSQAVLAYLRSPGRETLQAALRTCLSAREKLPDDLLNGFLTAFCLHETGDAAGEARILSGYRPEQKDVYRFIFYEHRKDVADALYFLPAHICAKQRQAPRAQTSFPPGSKCPAFGGPIAGKKRRSGEETVVRLLCPKCDAMLAARRSAKRKTPLVSIVHSVANSLDDRRRFKSEKRPTVRKLVSALGVREGQTVADIGCGIGQFTFPLAEKVGAKGRVYAEDIDENAVELIRYCVDRGGLKNIVPVPGTPTDMKLPADTLDMAVLIHVYRSMLAGLDEKSREYRESFLDGFFADIHKALKKDGVLALVDNAGPRVESSPEKAAEALKKRNFQLMSDRSDSRKRNFILFFKKSPPLYPKP